MLRTSGPIWLRAFALSTAATAVLAALLSLVHLRLGGPIAGAGSKPANDVTVCDCIVDDGQQTAIAMIRSNGREMPWHRRTYLISLELSGPLPTTVALLPQILQPGLEPISVAPGPDGQLLVAAVDG